MMECGWYSINKLLAKHNFLSESLISANQKYIVLKYPKNIVTYVHFEYGI